MGFMLEIKTFDFIQIAREYHLTTIIVTHDPEEALTISNRVLILEKGGIAQYGSPSEIINHPGSEFVKKLNKLIVETIKWLISYLSESDMELIESKYHSLYIITGLIMSRYDIDVENLIISKTRKIKEIEEECLDINRHIKEKWFLDENRQVGFFAKKLAELSDMK